MSGSSEMTPDGDAKGGSNVEVARLRNWNAGAPARLSPMSALPCVASIVTPQFVQFPPEKPMSPDPPLVSVLAIAVPESRYTSVPFAVHTVRPVSGFEAHEFTACAVGMSVGVMAVPSTFTTEMPVKGSCHAPFGTYATTFPPETSTERRLEGWQEPCGGAANAGTLKLSVFALDGAKTRTFGSDSEIVAADAGIIQAL